METNPVRPVPALVTLLLGLAYAGGGLLLMLLPGAAPMGPVRWSVGIPMLAIGLAHFALFPRFAGEKLPADAEYRGLDADGRPVVGTPQVREIAELIASETFNETLVFETSPSSVRVTSPVTSTRRGSAQQRFRWRSTIAATAKPDEFVRLDEVAATTSAPGSSATLLWGGRNTRTLPTSLVRAAVTVAGAKLRQSTAAAVGLLNAGAVGVLLVGGLLGVLIGMLTGEIPQPNG